MKTAVSIPEPVFRAADRLAKRLKKTRSGLYAAALREYLHRHDPTAVAGLIKDMVRRYGQPIDRAWMNASAEMLRRVEWE